MSSEKQEWLAEVCPDILVMEEFEEALVGICTRFGQEPIAIYDREKIIELLVAQGEDEESAIEWFEFNIIGGWVGPYTPAFLTRCP